MAGYLSTLRKRGITADAIADAVIRMRQPIIGGAGIKVTSGPSVGTCISLLSQPTRSRNPVALVKVTGNASGGGKYLGKVLRPPADPTPSTANLQEVHFMGGTETDEVLILNLAELERSTHDLTEGTPAVKHFIGFLLPRRSSDAPSRAVYVINSIDWEDCT